MSRKAIKYKKVVYGGPSGNDKEGDGSNKKPYRSLTKAVKEAING